MNLLGFDTATAACAVCVVRGDGEAFDETPPAERLADAPAHATELMPAVARALGRAELAFGDLDALAVGVGPGGFTGLRIGIATARGLATAPSGSSCARSRRWRRSRAASRKTPGSR